MRDHKPLTIRQCRVRKVGGTIATLMSIGLLLFLVGIYIYCSHQWGSDDPSFFALFYFLMLVLCGPFIIYGIGLEFLGSLGRLEPGELGSLYDSVQYDAQALRLLSGWVRQGYVLRQRDKKYLLGLRRRNANREINRAARESARTRDAKAEKALRVNGARNDCDT